MHLLARYIVAGMLSSMSVRGAATAAYCFVRVSGECWCVSWQGIRMLECCLACLLTTRAAIVAFCCGLSTPVEVYHLLEAVEASQRIRFDIRSPP